MTFGLVHWNRWDDKFDFNYDFLLVDRNWNSFGGYSLYSLNKVMPEGVTNIVFREIHIFRLGSTSHVPINIRSGKDFADDIVTCIIDEETAETMLLIMTNTERQEFVQAFNVRFDIPFDEPIIHESIWRGKTKESFIQNQERIKGMLMCPLDIATMIEANQRIGYK